MRTATKHVHRHDVLREALNDKGRYDARRMAKCLDWQQQEIAQYLQRDPSAVSSYPDADQFQEPLAKLGALVRHAETSLGEEKLEFVRAWLKTPVRALDRQIPKTLIVNGRLDVLSKLLDELDAGGVL
jgi:hypothetical protein